MTHVLGDLGRGDCSSHRSYRNTGCNSTRHCGASSGGNDDDLGVYPPLLYIRYVCGGLFAQ